MPRRLFERSKRRPGVTGAVIGVMASAALLLAWVGVRRLEGPDQASAPMLLEFMTVFLVLFGTLFVAGTIVGVIPRGTRRVGRR